MMGHDALLELLCTALLKQDCLDSSLFRLSQTSSHLLNIKIGFVFASLQITVQEISAE